VWALLFRGEKLPATMEAALEEYREVETVEVYRARGVLYCRGPCR
jgi:phosphoenolpyruvate carboxylase